MLWGNLREENGVGGFEFNAAAADDDNRMVVRVFLTKTTVEEEATMAIPFLFERVMYVSYVGGLVYLFWISFLLLILPFSFNTASSFNNNMMLSKVTDCVCLKTASTLDRSVITIIKVLD